MVPVCVFCGNKVFQRHNAYSTAAFVWTCPKCGMECSQANFVSEYRAPEPTPFDPCPFCGCDSIRASAFHISPDCFVSCSDCGAMIETTVPWNNMDVKEHDEACRKALIPLWNRRNNERKG